MAPSDEVKRLGSILGVWAHPDDEVFSSGGVMAWASALGQEINIVTATKGEAGVQDESRWPRRELAQIRAAEAQQASQLLGVANYHWLGYGDGFCHEVPEAEAAERIAGYIKQYQPDTVITFSPDGITGHTDHQAVHRWTSLAAQQLGQTDLVLCAVETVEGYRDYLSELDEKINIFFNVEEPTLVPRQLCDQAFILPDVYLNKKLKALQVMESQTSAIDFDNQQFRAAMAHEEFVRLNRGDIAWNPAYWQ